MSSELKSDWVVTQMHTLKNIPLSLPLIIKNPPDV